MNVWSIPSVWGFTILLSLLLVVIPTAVMGSNGNGNGPLSSITTTATDLWLLRGGAAKKAVTAATGPLGVFVQTVMDARRHLVAAAGM